tara:strand:+ start:9 stop:1103 length:1095 start_codon:yes stop_codon:yes gene_type:complete
MKIAYIAETSLSNKSAYTLHVLKMCDAFSKQGEVQLILPHIKSNFKLNKIKKDFLLTPKKKFTVKGILKYKVKNFLNRIYFGYKSAKYIKKTNSNIVLTRSIIASFFLCIFKVKHFLEIHNELNGLTKFLMINLNFINSYYITNIILISKTLSKIFPKIKKNKTLILHDAVNIKNFKYRKDNNKIRNLTYIGSFYKGKGIELILELAKYFKNLNFNIYGEPLKKIDNISGNVKIHGYINYKKVPNALAKSDILLLPSADLQFGRAKNINITNYNSPLKMFDYLASGKIILASKRDGICEVLKHNYNSIIVNKYDLDNWIIEINKIMNKKYNLIKLKKNSIKTAKRHTWDKRVDIILTNCVNSDI